MSPKEKAVILVDRYLSETINIDLDVNWHFEMSKRLALICCDEIIKSGPSFPYDIQFDSMPHFRSLKYWQQVKNEINQIT